MWDEKIHLTSTQELLLVEEVWYSEMGKEPLSKSAFYRQIETQDSLLENGNIVVYYLCFKK